MADANAESIQQKIQIARRDAEALKDRIKRKKDDLADTTRESTPHRCHRIQRCTKPAVTVAYKSPKQCVMSRDNGQNSCPGWP